VSEQLKDWGPEAALGLAVLVVGLLEVSFSAEPFYGVRGVVLVVVAFALAVGLCRKAPFAGLAIVWVTCALQLVTGTPLLGVELSVAIVAFGCARWGSRLTLFVSGLSIPAAALAGFVVVSQETLGIFRRFPGADQISDGNFLFADARLVALMAGGLFAVAVPWLLGLVLRATARAELSEEKTEQAEADAMRAQVAADQAREIARLQEDQARLARDVHDVVGHSLAVILAQAESGQYLSDDDPAALKRTLATIAGSARSSLQDVRQVLAQEGEVVPARSGAFEELVEGVRAGGHEVRVTDVGQARVMAPELDVAAHRVVQEMLTNAIKHGRRDRPVAVERHWPEGSWDRDLRIEVRNVEMFDSHETQPLNAAGPPGQGIDGMRRRLESVGGRLDVRRRQEDGEPTFTVTAWLPVSGR
jgi:signal transduction histidine kinase